MANGGRLLRKGSRAARDPHRLVGTLEFEQEAPNQRGEPTTLCYRIDLMRGQEPKTFEAALWRIDSPKLVVFEGWLEGILGTTAGELIAFASRFLEARAERAQSRKLRPEERDPAEQAGARGL